MTLFIAVTRCYGWSPENVYRSFHDALYAWKDTNLPRNLYQDDKNNQNANEYARFGDPDSDRIQARDFCASFSTRHLQPLGYAICECVLGYALPNHALSS